MILTRFRYAIGLVRPPEWYGPWRERFPEYELTKSSEIQNSKANWDTLLRVKTRVDRKGLYRPDLKGDECTGFVPIEDGPDAGKPGGDCEDFDFEYLKGLRKAGLPRGAMRFAMCQTERKEWHAVLVIRMKGQVPVILDQRFRDRLWFKNVGPMQLYRYWAWEVPGRYWWEPMP